MNSYSMKIEAVVNGVPTEVELPWDKMLEVAREVDLYQMIHEVREECAFNDIDLTNEQIDEVARGVVADLDEQNYYGEPSHSDEILQMIEDLGYWEDCDEEEAEEDNENS